MIPRIEFLDWFEGRPEAALHDLGTVGLRRPAQVSGGVPAPVADLPKPPAGVTPETLLATSYGVHPSQVVVTCGADHAALLAEATALALATGKEDRDAGADGGEPTVGSSLSPRVLVEKPGPEAAVKRPAWLGAKPDRVLRNEDGTLAPERVEKASGPATCLVSLTNRHDPTGALADRDALAAIVDAATDGDDENAADEDAFETRVLVDESTAGFVDPSGQPGDADGSSGPFGGPTAAGLPGAVVADSLGPVAGLPELGVGWLVADEQFVEAARAVNRHLPGPADVSRALATRALHGAADLRDRAGDRLASHAATLAAFVDARSDLSGAVHADAPVAFLGHETASGDHVASMAGDAGVLVVPGRFFDDPDRFRVALGGDPADAAAALDSLGQVLDRVG